MSSRTTDSGAVQVSANRMAALVAVALLSLTTVGLLWPAVGVTIGLALTAAGAVYSIRSGELWKKPLASAPESDPNQDG